MNTQRMKNLREKMKAMKSPKTKVLGLGQSQIALSKNSIRKRLTKFNEIKNNKSRSVTNLIDFNNITNNTDFTKYTIITVDKLSIITKTVNVENILNMKNTLFFHLTRQFHVTKNNITEKLVTNINKTYHRISVPFNFIINNHSYNSILHGLKNDKMNVITIEKSTNTVNIVPAKGDGSYETDVPLYEVKKIESI